MGVNLVVQPMGFKRPDGGPEAPGQACPRRDSRARRRPAGRGRAGSGGREIFEPLGEVMGGGLAFERGVHRQHDLVDPARGDPPDQLSMPRSSGRTPSSADSRPPSTWIAAGEQPGAVERPQIGDLLDHAQQLASRRGSVQMRRGRWCRHCRRSSRSTAVRDTFCSAASSGSSAASRFFIKCSTARRAERGPSPAAAPAPGSALRFPGCHRRDDRRFRPRAQARHRRGHADHLHGIAGLRGADALRSGRGEA